MRKNKMTPSVFCESQSFQLDLSVLLPCTSCFFLTVMTRSHTCERKIDMSQVSKTPKHTQKKLLPHTLSKKPVVWHFKHFWNLKDFFGLLQQNSRVVKNVKAIVAHTAAALRAYYKTITGFLQKKAFISCDRDTVQRLCWWGICKCGGFVWSL